MSGPYRYRYAGFEIASWMPLPELDEGRGGATDVHIVHEPVSRPAGAETPFGYYAEIPRGAVLEIPACARFAITGGDTVAMEVLGDPDPILLRLYLLGSVLGALLHQRGVLPLHAGAVALEGRAFALVGGSGAGKSTLTALLATAGAAYLADDVCPIGARDVQTPAVWPGVKRVRLSLEACEALALGDATGHADPFGKRILDPPWRRPDGPLPLCGLLILRTDGALEAPQLVPASVREVLTALVAHTYRPTFIAADRRGAHLETCTALAAQLPGWHLARPWGIERAPKDTPELLRALATLPTHAPRAGR